MLLVWFIHVCALREDRNCDTPFTVYPYCVHPNTETNTSDVRFVGTSADRLNTDLGEGPHSHTVLLVWSFPYSNSLSPSSHCFQYKSSIDDRAGTGGSTVVDRQSHQFHFASEIIIEIIRKPSRCPYKGSKKPTACSAGVNSEFLLSIVAKIWQDP